MKYYFIIFLCVILGACGMMPKFYKEPITGNTAVIEFQNRAGSGQLSGGIYEHYENCKGLLSIPQLENEQALPLKVSSEKPLSFLISLTRNNTICYVHATFTPAANAKYITYITDVDNGCRLAFFEESSTGLKPVDIQRRLPISLFWGSNSSQCE